MAVVPLHIPNGGWAYDWDGEMTGVDENAWLQNVWEVERWSRSVSCPSETPNYERADWTTVPFHGGVMVFTPQSAEGAYLALERWATNICGFLHVPYKRWAYEDVRLPQQEEANWRAVEDWALGIGACCSGGGGG